MAIDVLTGGAFQDASGAPIASGTITFQLSQSAYVAGTGQVVNSTVISYNLLANGNIASSPSPTLWGNDQLTPSGSYYIVNIMNSSGAVVRGPENWIISGTSPISLSAIVPLSGL